MLATLDKNMSSLFRSRRSALHSIANQFNLLNSNQINRLYESYEKDAERVIVRLNQAADQRKAAIDRQAANRAKAIYNEAVDRATAAGKEVSKLSNKRVIIMENL
jgi:hypothetical protein